MSRTAVALLLVYYATTLSARVAEGETPVLVGDLRSDPVIPTYSDNARREASPVDFLARTYFTFRDDQHGRELWTSDGTPEGTSIFLDACAGPCSSDPGPLVVAGDRLFFFADDGVSGAELWATDGTPEGTVLVTDFCPGECGWHRIQAVALGSRLIFVGELTTPSTRRLFLASSDGTASGTLLLLEYTQDAFDPHLITRHGDRVLFGFEGVLRSTDGTPEGTVHVSDLRGSSGPNGLATFGNKTFFTRGASLFVTDGTDAGTKNLRFLNPEIEALTVFDRVHVGRAEQFVDLDGTTYFFVHGSVTSVGQVVERICTLWRSDGSVEGTSLVTRLLPAGRTRCPLSLVAHRGHLYFDFITPEMPGDTLWTSDGTASGARSLGAPLWRWLDGARAFGDFLYFAGPEGIWRTDATPEGTLVLPFLQGHGIEGLIAGSLFLQSSSQGGERIVLSTSDGTEQGTLPFTSVPQWFSSSHPDVLTDFGGRVFFSATDDEAEKVYTTGVVDVTDVEVFLEDDDGFLFGGTTPEAAGFGDLLAINLDGLLVSDGSAASVSSVGQGLIAAGGLTPLGEHLYFAGTTVAESTEPWVSDGSESGSRLLMDIVPGGDVCCIAPPISGASSPGEFTPLGEHVLFVAEGRLWSTDGSEAGTFLVTDFLTGSARVSDLAVLDPWVLFAATGPDSGRELWRSDGTPEGTLLLADLEAGGASSHPSGLTAYGDLVLFATGNPDRGRLWASDGTSEGTVPVLDLADSGAARVEDLTVVGDKLFFVATTSSAGRELWVSDATAQGTRLVRDVFPGAASSDPRSLTASGDVLLFSANDGRTGSELWRSDGTSAGTRRLSDLDPGPRSSHPGSLHVADQRLFFAAATEAQGRELWSLRLSEPGNECADIPFLGTPEEIAATPRDDENLEALALHMGDGLSASQETYDRVVADIGLIRALLPDLDGIDYFPRQDGKTLSLRVDGPTLAAIQAESYSSWDCLNDYYGFESLVVDPARRTVELTLKGLYDVARLVPLYTQLPGIETGLANLISGDGPTVCALVDSSSTYHYFFDEASGDCLSGCSDHDVSYLTTSSFGAIPVVRGRWSSAQDPGDAPPWLEIYQHCKSGRNPLPGRISPGDSDDVVLTVSGQDGNRICGPFFNNVEVDPSARTIRIESDYNPSCGPCAPEATPYSFDVDVGPLPVGEYQVSVVRRDGCGASEELDALSRLTVGSEETRPSCVGGQRPAATLLVPYFEVDLADPEGPRTIISVNNADTEPVVARVVLWTDWGLPSFAFNVFLGPNDMQTLDLRSVLTRGALPGDPRAGAPCTAEILDPVTLAELRAKHTGRPSPVDGLCHGSRHAPADLAVGYITVDAMNGCAGTTRFPMDDGYFEHSGTGFASNRNVLWGDVLYLSSAEASAQGTQAVAIMADATRVQDLVTDGSFYRSYLGDARDNRVPLSTLYRSRLLNGGSAGMTTELLVWSEGPGGAASPRVCDEPFPESPESLLHTTFRDEQGKPFGSAVHRLFERTSKLPVGQAPLEAAKGFGQIDLRTGIACNSCDPPSIFDPHQTWATVVLRAAERFSTAQHATRLEGVCP